MNRRARKNDCPKKLGLRKSKAIIIPAGSFFVTIPLPKTPQKEAEKWVSTNKEHRELKNLAEKAATEDAVNRAKATSTLMIETDILYAYVKIEDCLKTAANKLISGIIEGEFGTVYASRESLHEIYYVSKAEGASTDELIARTAALKSHR